MDIVEKWLLSPLIDSENVKKYIPQKEPFVMVDTLLFCDEQTAISGFTVKKENPCVQQGVLLESGMIENIAQTVALKRGYEALLLQKLSPSKGFIAYIKDLRIQSLIVTGETIITQIKIVAKLGSLISVKADSYCNNKKLMACEICLCEG